jgi:hypothetical protein
VSVDHVVRNRPGTAVHYENRIAGHIHLREK